MSRIEYTERTELGGFQKISAGWHRCEVGDPIELMKNKDGELVTSKYGGNSYRLKVPFVVSEGGEEDGRKEDLLMNYKDPAHEKNLAGLIMACGLWPKFTEHFDFDKITLWDDAPFTAVKTKLPGKTLDVFFETRTSKDKDGKESTFVNPTIMQKLGLPKDGEKGKGKAGKKAAAPAAPADFGDAPQQQQAAPETAKPAAQGWY